MKDDGAIHVFEAVITGMLVLTSILFMTALSKPESAEASSGIDLARMADDTLAIMLARPAEDSATYTNRLEEVVDEAIRGDESAHTFIQDVLPPGTRYLLRLDNGVGPMTLLPGGSGPATSPRNAEAAEVFLLMNWTAHSQGVAANTLQPGEPIDFSGWSSLTGPTGSVNAPGGLTWRQWWEQEVPAMDRVPDAVPYGKWLIDGSPDLHIYAEGASSLPTYPLYSIQLVVWSGA